MRFPNLEGKHEHDSMINPNEFANYMKSIGRAPDYKFPKAVIISYSRPMLEHVLENHEVEEYKFSKGKIYLLKETNGEVAIIGGFGIGSPAAVVVLEELIAYGAKKIMSIGTAGTLQKDLDLGSLIVCDRAIRDEGTSYHYLPAEKYAYADKDMTKKLEDTLTKYKLDYVVGTSWTIDAPYRETITEAKHYQDEGVLTVEMEASALFAVAKYRGVPISSLLTVSDSLAELEWKPDFYHDKTISGLETIFKVALSVLRD